MLVKYFKFGRKKQRFGLAEEDVKGLAVLHIRDIGCNIETVFSGCYLPLLSQQTTGHVAEQSDVRMLLTTLVTVNQAMLLNRVMSSPVSLTAPQQQLLWTIFHSCQQQ